MRFASRLQAQPAFLLMTDASTAGYRVIPEQSKSGIAQLMQAYFIYSLSIRLPVALMAEVRFQQVGDVQLHTSVCSIMVIYEHTRKA